MKLIIGDIVGQFQVFTRKMQNEKKVVSRWYTLSNLPVFLALTEKGRTYRAKLFCFETNYLTGNKQKHKT